MICHTVLCLERHVGTLYHKQEPQGRSTKKYLFYRVVQNSQRLSNGDGEALKVEIGQYDKLFLNAGQEQQGTRLRLACRLVKPL